MPGLTRRDTARLGAGIRAARGDSRSGRPGGVTSAGDLRLPAPVRRWCTLDPGSRVLLVADPDRRRLVIHPPAWLDTMISREYATVFGGDPV